MILLWAQQGLNLRPPDYESGATNQLSYRPALVAAKLHICSEISFLAMTNNIQNIIFDLGGVIINLDIPRTTQAFIDLAHRYGIKDFSPNGELDIFKQFEVGAISSEEFRDALRKVLHPNTTDEEIDFAWNAMLLDIPASRLELLLQLKNKYRIFLLSNTNEIHYDGFHDILRATHPYENLEPFFHQVYYSHLIQLRKPDAEVFQYILDQHGLQAENTLFLDDTPMHLEGASKLGIQTQQVTNQYTVHDILKDF